MKISSLAISKTAPVVRKIRRILKTHPRLVIVAKFLTVYGIFLAFTWYKTYDPDFGWHLQAGNYIRENGIPATDIYTYTASSFRWVNHEWLSDVILSVIYGGWGYFGLSVMYAGMWTVSLFIAKAYTRFSILVIAALAQLPYSGVRATTWTVLTLSILIYILRSKNKRLIYFIPPLFLIWANLHGGFFIGLAVVAFYLLKKRNTKWLSVLGLSILASFINPYGIRLYEEIFRTLFDNSLRWQIAEWFPATFMLIAMPFIYSLIWASTWVINLGKDWKRKLIDVSPIFFLASLSSTRHFPLFVLVSAGEVDANIKKVKKSIPRNLDWKRRLLVYSLPILIAILTFWEVYAVVFRVVKYNNIQEFTYPAKAVEYLKQNPCSGRLLNSYNFGGYLIWRLPGVLLYIDGRQPSWRDESGVKYFDRYSDLEHDPDAANGQEFFRYNIRCVLWPESKEKMAMIESLERASWIKVEEASSPDYTLWLAPNINLDKPLPKF